MIPLLLLSINDSVVAASYYPSICLLHEYAYPPQLLVLAYKHCNFALYCNSLAQVVQPLSLNNPICSDDN
jgi:hypothetical protein